MQTKSHIMSIEIQPSPTFPRYFVLVRTFLVSTGQKCVVWYLKSQSKVFSLLLGLSPNASFFVRGLGGRDRK